MNCYDCHEEDILKRGKKMRRHGGPGGQWVLSGAQVHSPSRGPGGPQFLGRVQGQSW